MKHKTSILPSSEIEFIRAQIDLLALAEGFFESRVLFALNKLGVFRLLEKDASTAGEIAERLGVESGPFLRLLNAGVMLELLQLKDELYRVSPAWLPLLAYPEAEAYLGNWIGFLDYSSRGLTDLDQAAAHGGPTTHLLQSKNKQDIREFVLAMHNYAALRGKELVHSLDTHSCKTLLDLGCGPGTYAFHLGLRNPELELHLLDLPEVLEVTKEVQARYPLKNEINYIPLDVTKEEVPGTYDLVLVSNMLHMLGEDASRALLRRLYETVNPSGSLVVQFQRIDENRIGGRWPVLLDLLQLCFTKNGRNHTVSETRRWLEEAGYQDTEFSELSLLNTNCYLRAYRH